MEYKDTIHCRTEAKLSWVDRLRVALGSNIRTRIEIDCENMVGATTSRARTFVDRVFPCREKETAYALEEGGHHGQS